jgi:hypothetical protein
MASVFPLYLGAGPVSVSSWDGGTIADPPIVTGIFSGRRSDGSIVEYASLIRDFTLKLLFEHLVRWNDYSGIGRTLRCPSFTLSASLKESQSMKVEGGVFEDDLTGLPLGYQARSPKCRSLRL